MEFPRCNKNGKPCPSYKPKKNTKRIVPNSNKELECILRKSPFVTIIWGIYVFSNHRTWKSKFSPPSEWNFVTFWFFAWKQSFFNRPKTPKPTTQPLAPSTTKFVLSGNASSTWRHCWCLEGSEKRNSGYLNEFAWICFLVIFYGYDPMGKITHVSPLIWENMFLETFSKHRRVANPSYIKWIPPRKLTWSLKITPLEKKIIFNPYIFWFHVSFRECIIGSPRRWRWIR